MQKPSQLRGFCMSYGGVLLSRNKPVPSAQSDLTTLFGMERGDPRRNNHHVLTR